MRRVAPARLRDTIDIIHRMFRIKFSRLIFSWIVTDPRNLRSCSTAKIPAIIIYDSASVSDINMNNDILVLESTRS